MTMQQSIPQRAEKQVAALVVTHFPDAGFPSRLDKLLEQVSHVVIIDNGSPQDLLSWQKQYCDSDNITFLKNSVNLGIATALNQGMDLLTKEGFERVVTFDQDSTVTSGFIALLQATMTANEVPHGDVALVGANRSDAGENQDRHRWLRPKKRWPFFERITCDRIGPDGVTLVITSGTLFNMKIFNILGPFRDDFFIDFVDSEYCLRAKEAGYRILVNPDARLFHQLGSKKQYRLFGLTMSPTFHSPLRRYYLSRNRIEMMRLYGLTFPHWLIYELMALIHITLSILFYEDQKIAKLQACAIGTCDGLLKRMGPAKRIL
ncbi:MAG: glycosyltransferase family 2 protein [Methylobacter sp.]|nr:glycosyltransferase family 2 protein [Methylobacter sp.]